MSRNDKAPRPSGPGALVFGGDFFAGSEKFGVGYCLIGGCGIMEENWEECGYG